MVDESEQSVGTFEDFMNQFSTPMTESGDIDFERSSNQIGMRQEDIRSRQMNDGNEQKNLGTGENDGTFWMDYDNFLMAFQVVDVCLAFRGQHAKSFQTNFPPKTGK